MIKLIKNKIFICGLLAGLLIGITCFTFLISYRIDNYHRQIKELQTSIEGKDLKLKRLEETINKRKFIVKDIEIVLIAESDEFDKMTLEKHIKQKYSSIIGQEVKSIDLELVTQIIDNRIFRIDKTKYQLLLTKLLLSDTLKLWITVKQIE